MAQTRVLQQSQSFGTQTPPMPPSGWGHFFGVAPEQSKACPRAGAHSDSAITAAAMSTAARIARIGDSKGLRKSDDACPVNRPGGRAPARGVRTRQRTRAGAATLRSMEDTDMTRGARFRIGLAIAMSLSGVAMRATAAPHHHDHRIRNHAAEQRDHRKKLREEQARKERAAREAQAAQGRGAAGRLDAGALALYFASRGVVEAGSTRV